MILGDILTQNNILVYIYVRTLGLKNTLTFVNSAQNDLKFGQNILEICVFSIKKRILKHFLIPYFDYK